MVGEICQLAYTQAGSLVHIGRSGASHSLAETGSTTGRGAVAEANVSSIRKQLLSQSGHRLHGSDCTGGR